MREQGDPPANRAGRPALFMRRHRLVCFFALSYAISWLAWTPYVLSRDGIGVLRFTFPALPGDTHSELTGILPGAYLGPLSSAFLVTIIAEGSAGLRVWRNRLVRWGVNWRWYVFSLVGLPILLVVGTLAFPGAAATFRLPAATVLAAYLPSLLIQTITSGLAEEPGWRDFALPHLQRRYGPLGATLVLGSLWSLWHLPLFATHWATVRGDLLYFGLFLLVGIMLSIIITWVFNHSSESLPLAMLLHASNNNAWTVVWPAMFPALDPSWDLLYASLLTYGVLAAVLVLVTHGRLGYHPEFAVETLSPEARLLSS